MDPNDKNQHVILRQTQPRDSRVNPAGGFSIVQPHAGHGARRDSIKLEIESVKPSAVPSFKKDNPDVVAFAPVVPMKLIKPYKRSRPRAAIRAGQVAWGINAVGASASQFTGRGVVVAVLDTGIDRDHPVFAGVDILERNFTEEKISTDTHGHGTHCAGTIFGQTIDGNRIGVAPGIDRALIAKVLGTGGGSSLEIIKAMYWALDNGANVISMSLGMDFPRLQQDLVAQGMNRLAATSQALAAYHANVLLFSSMAEMISQSHQIYQPCVVVAAAGNESNRPTYEIAVSPPAVSDGFISVAALEATNGENFKIADFSNTGSNVAGPGVDILSAVPGGNYANMSGTSMATPHVAGVAALWHEKFSSKNQAVDLRQLIRRIEGSANYDNFSPGYEMSEVGLGMVQAP